MESLRLFFAIAIDPALKGELEGLEANLAKPIHSSNIRWVAPKNIHLTLCFLGNVNRARVTPLQSVLEDVARAIPSFELTAQGVGCFPNFKRPNNIWVGLEGDVQTAALLARTLETRLSALGFPKDDRGFTPHLTLGRVKRELSGAERERIGSVVREFRTDALGAIHADAIHLISSDLTPSGPIHTTLASAHLGASEQSN